MEINSSKKDLIDTKESIINAWYTRFWLKK
jgi:hypothetical protein